MVPLSAARWLSVELHTESRPLDWTAKEPLQREPQPQIYTLYPKPRLSPPAYREGCLQALRGGWTDGKDLARWPRKANYLLELLYEGLANVQGAQKEGSRKERKGKGKKYREGMEWMKGVPLSKISVRVLCFVGSQGLNRTSAEPWHT